jgi:hypothetical protein
MGERQKRRDIPPIVLEEKADPVALPDAERRQVARGPRDDLLKLPISQCPLAIGQRDGLRLGPGVVEDRLDQVNGDPPSLARGRRAAGSRGVVCGEPVGL